MGGANIGVVGSIDPTLILREFFTSYTPVVLHLVLLPIQILAAIQISGLFVLWKHHVG